MKEKKVIKKRNRKNKSLLFRLWELTTYFTLESGKRNVINKNFCNFYRFLYILNIFNERKSFPIVRRWMLEVTTHFRKNVSYTINKYAKVNSDFFYNWVNNGIRIGDVKIGDFLLVVNEGSIRPHVTEENQENTKLKSNDIYSSNDLTETKKEYAVKVVGINEYIQYDHNSSDVSNNKCRSELICVISNVMDDTESSYYHICNFSKNCPQSYIDTFHKERREYKTNKFTKELNKLEETLLKGDKRILELNAELAILT